MADNAAVNELASMIVRIIGDGSSFTKMAKGLVSNTEDISKSVKKTKKDVRVFGDILDELGTKMSGMAGQFRAMAALQSPFQMIKSGVSLAAEAEQMEISFGTILQDMEKGVQLREKLQTLADSTPLNLEPLQHATKTLLQFGVAGDQILPTLQQIGDVTGGDAEKMQSMALAFGQMLSTGRLMGQELNQMINAGVNPLQIIAENKAKQQGGTAAQFMPGLKHQMEQGQLSVQMVKDALKSATSEGGKFFGLMEKQSKTLNGLYSSMRDNINGATREVGKFVIEQFKLKEILMKVAETAQKFTDWFKLLDLQTKKVLVTTIMFIASFGSLIVTWKVGAIAVGQVVGVLKDMVITIEWLLGGFRKMLVYIVSLLNPLKLLVAMVNLLTISVKLLLKATAIGLVLAVVVQLLDQFGGIEEIVQNISEKLRIVWQEINPIRQALSSLFTTLWDTLKSIGTVIIQVTNLDSILEGIDWGKIRDKIVEVILFAEYATLNWKQVLDVLWAGLQYQVIRFGNIIEYVWTEGIPTAINKLIKWIEGVWPDFVLWIADTFLAAMEFAFDKIPDLFNLQMRLIKAFFTGTMADIMNRMATVMDLMPGGAGKGAAMALKQMARVMKIKDELEAKIDGKGADKFAIPKPPEEIKFPERILGEREKKLKEEFERLKDVLMIGFEEFKKMKLEQFAEFGWGGDFGDAEKAGADMGEAINKGLGKEMQKVDAVLIGSAEAFSRIASYQETLNRPPGGIANPGNNPMVAGQNRQVAAIQQGDKAIVDQLKITNQGIAKIANNNALAVANFEEV